MGFTGLESVAARICLAGEVRGRVRTYVFVRSIEFF